VVSETASGVSGEYLDRGLEISLHGSEAPVFVNIDAMQLR
jgi:hypothetical protein